MPLVLTPQIKDLVNNALASGTPLLLAVVTADNKPLLSFRGSTQVYSDDQLGVWVRKTTGATLEAILRNPNVALMYRSHHAAAAVPGPRLDRHERGRARPRVRKCARSRAQIRSRA